jgi:hypothetical protein
MSSAELSLLMDNSAGSLRASVDTHIVPYGAGIGVSDPGHLPLTRAHVWGRHINARTWEHRERAVYQFFKINLSQIQFSKRTKSLWLANFRSPLGN